MQKEGTIASELVSLSKGVHGLMCHRQKLIDVIAQPGAELLELRQLKAIQEVQSVRRE